MARVQALPERLAMVDGWWQAVVFAAAVKVSTATTPSTAFSPYEEMATPIIGITFEKPT